MLEPKIIAKLMIPNNGMVNKLNIAIVTRRSFVFHHSNLHSTCSMCCKTELVLRALRPSIIRTKYFKNSAAVSLFLIASQLVRLRYVCEKLFLYEQSGHTLVRGFSDLMNSVAVFLVAYFILKKSRKLSQNLSTLNSSIKLPIKINFLAFALQLLVFSLNFFSALVSRNQLLYYLSCITTDFFIVSMDIQIIFVQYILAMSFKNLNIKIAIQPLNDQSVHHLRLDHSKITEISENIHHLHSAITLALISTHSFYLQIDLFYLTSSVYNLHEHNVTQVGDKDYIFEYILWSFVNIMSIILIVCGYSIAEKEVFPFF